MLIGVGRLVTKDLYTPSQRKQYNEIIAMQIA